MYLFKKNVILGPDLLNCLNECTCNRLTLVDMCAKQLCSGHRFLVERIPQTHTHTHSHGCAYIHLQMNNYPAQRRPASSSQPSLRPRVFRTDFGSSLWVLSSAVPRIRPNATGKDACRVWCVCVFALGRCVSLCVLASHTNGACGWRFAFACPSLIS